MWLWEFRANYSNRPSSKEPIRYHGCNHILNRCYQNHFRVVVTLLYTTKDESYLMLLLYHHSDNFSQQHVSLEHWHFSPLLKVSLFLNQEIFSIHNSINWIITRVYCSSRVCQSGGKSLRVQKSNPRPDILYNRLLRLLFPADVFIQLLLQQTLELSILGLRDWLTAHIKT